MVKKLNRKKFIVKPLFIIFFSGKSFFELGLAQNILNQLTTPDMDETDLKILRLLQQNAQLTIKEIAAQINLSLTPVHDRIKKLEESGVIEKYVAILHKKKLGKPLMVYCNVTLDRQVQEHFVAFNEAIGQMPEVVECNVVSGNFDYLLKIIIKDMEAYQTFYTSKLSVIKSIDKISSFFVMAEVKNTTQIPI